MAEGWTMQVVIKFCIYYLNINLIRVQNLVMREDYEANKRSMRNLIKTTRDMNFIALIC